MLLSRTDSISLWRDLPSRTMTLPLALSALPSPFCLGSASNLPPPPLCNLPCNLPPAAFMAVSQTRVMGTRSCPSGRMQLTDSELRFSLLADACCCAPETIQRCCRGTMECVSSGGRSVEAFWVSTKLSNAAFKK